MNKSKKIAKDEHGLWKPYDYNDQQFDAGNNPRLSIKYFLF